MSTNNSDMDARRSSSSSSMGMSDDAAKKPTKKTPNDFIFGKSIGEGSFSTVYLAKEVGSDKEVAVKVLDKRHIIRERKNQYVMREREILMKLNHPFFIQLYCTFQDAERLYFVMSYARGGELLHYLNKLSSFDLDCTKFYAAEIVIALQHLRNLGIIHRDLKPENILLNEAMHIQITDFGSAKILKDAPPEENLTSADGATSSTGRRNSFVGTAQYVSPEILTSKKASYSSDLWALGCIIYQFLAGLPPFRGGHEYQIFQKITKLEYEFPDGFPSSARDIVEKLVVIDQTKRLGCPEMEGFPSLMAHSFFEGIKWDHLTEEQAPRLMPYLPATNHNEEMWGSERTGFDDKRLVEIITDTVMTADERKKQLLAQAKENKFHKYVENHLILKQGLVDKRKCPIKCPSNKIGQYYQVVTSVCGKQNYYRIVSLVSKNNSLANQKSVKDYAKKKTDNDDLEEAVTGELSDLDKYLLKSQDLIVIRGKRGKPVPVIVPMDTCEMLKFLASSQVRTACEIQDSNTYLFANSHIIREEEPSEHTEPVEVSIDLNDVDLHTDSPLEEESEDEERHKKERKTFLQEFNGLKEKRRN